MPFVQQPQGQSDSDPVLAAGRNLWSYWADLTGGGFKEAHFATFPLSLPVRCLKLGTSERGCCSRCGAGWVRVVERTKKTRQRPNDYTKRTGETGTGNSCSNSAAGVDAKTTGWRPGCDCEADTVPCRVLDPFSGAGTTGVAAKRLGLHYTGIELNPEYAEMSRRRISRDGQRGDVKAVAPAPGQQDLF